MKYLLSFKKSGKLIYNGHLDTIRIIEESLRRAKCPFEFSKGFNPKPLFSFSNPIPFGYINRNFFLTVETKKSFDFSSFDVYTPRGLNLNFYKEVDDKFRLSKALKGFDFKVYLSENLFYDFENIKVIQKGKSEYKKEAIFEELRIHKNKNNVFMLKYYQDYNMIYNILKIFNIQDYKEFLCFPICDKTYWR
ncbi:TIGR03936 family radical SAM-associated protein [Geotoga petraea]|uniref:Radical SAM-linked protein n=1 Tax=Geotoga petraea TaxID=28234 RepID=A0A1G6I0J2_9BACT|nr:TIGR03936 family radical SAM-associated protein [Geotoga petraea]SDC00079.1 radical SAM-linked protein [Geotoga petraea]